MKDFASYYDVLRISENASEEEIKKAYRKLVLQFHPDRVPPESPDLKKVAEEEFKRIQEAYNVLSEQGKRKQYDEQLKDLKAKQSAGQGSSQGSPVLRVDKNYFKFDSTNISVSEILTVINDGGGVLIGTITADKPWVKLSETVINTSDYQEIEITIDTASLPAGFSDSALVEIDTSGGNETVAVDISMESSFLTLYFAYLKPIVNSFWCWALTTILAVIFLISCVIYSYNRSPAIDKTSWPEEKEVVVETLEIPRDEIPQSEDFPGDWREPTPQTAESKPPVEDVAIYQTLFSKRGPVGCAPVVIERRDAAGNVSERRIEYLRKEEMENVLADNEEQKIYYPATGAFYPIKKSRYPEFYKKCDLDGDGVITLYELGETQEKLSKITAKYPEGDVDSIVREFVK